MALQIIEQGPRNLVVRATGTAMEPIDVATLVPPCAELRLMGLQYNLPSDATDGGVYWEATVPEPAYLLNTHEGNHCFKYFGGISNNAGAGKTGNTFIDAGGGTVIAVFKKINPVIPL